MRAVRLLVSALVLVVVVACGQEPERVEPSTSAAATLWRELGTWSGSGSRQTESFDVTSGALRLTWEASEAPSAQGHLRVSLHSAISGRPLHTAVDHAGTGSDTVRIPTQPRVAYLLVESEGVEWSLRLEEGVPGGDPFP